MQQPGSEEEQITYVWTGQALFNCCNRNYTGIAQVPPTIISFILSFIRKFIY